MDDDLISKLDDYLSGEMVGSTRDAFEETIKSNAELQEQMVLHKQAESILGAVGKRQIFEEVRELHQEIDPSISADKKQSSLQTVHKMEADLTKRTTNLWLKIAAILVVFLGVLYLIPMLSSKDNELQSLYEEYFEPFEDIVTVMGTEDQLTSAMRHYNQQEYEQATIGFASVGKESIYYDEALLYQGISLMQQNKIEQAVLNFKQIIDLESPLAEVAAWNRILCQLKLENRESAIINLSDYIGNSKYSYKKNTAQNLLNQLD